MWLDAASLAAADGSFYSDREFTQGPIPPRENKVRVPEEKNEEEKSKIFELEVLLDRFFLFARRYKNLGKSKEKKHYSNTHYREEHVVLLSSSCCQSCWLASCSYRFLQLRSCTVGRRTAVSQPYYYSVQLAVFGRAHRPPPIAQRSLPWGTCLAYRRGSSCRRCLPRRSRCRSTTRAPPLS